MRKAEEKLPRPPHANPLLAVAPRVRPLLPLPRHHRIRPGEVPCRRVESLRLLYLLQWLLRAWVLNPFELFGVGHQIGHVLRRWSNPPMKLSLASSVYKPLLHWSTLRERCEINLMLMIDGGLLQGASRLGICEEILISFLHPKDGGGETGRRREGFGCSWQNWGRGFEYFFLILISTSFSFYFSPCQTWEKCHFLLTFFPGHFRSFKTS